MRRWTAMSALLAGCLAAAPALAGTIIETESSSQGMNRMFVSGDQVRMDSDDTYMIFDAAASEMTFVNTAERRYQVMTEQDIRRMGERIRQMRQQMEQQLQNMPEEQRAQARQQMEQMMPSSGEQPELRVEATGGTDQVAGAECREARVYRDGDLAHEVCVAEPGALGIAAGDFDTVMAMFGFLEKMAGSLGGGADQIGGREMRQMMDELGGMPARSSGQGEADSWEIRSVESGSIDAGRFEIPDGFQRMQGMGAMQ